MEKELKTFQDKHKLKAFIITNPELLRIFKGIKQTEEEDKHNHKSTGKNESH